MTHTLEVTWPITDPDVPLGQLKAQALADLRTMSGVTILGRPGWHIRHGATPTLTARVPVRVPA